MDLSLFNQQQQQAILSSVPYIKVIAGAGSGKTAVLTNRIAYLIKERGVNPRKILAITFTNKAANEMKERVQTLLEDQVFTGSVSTFHSFCYKILREDINVIGYNKDFIILDSQDAVAVLKDLNKKLKFDSEVYKPKAILAYISNVKNEVEDDDIDAYTLEVYQETFKAYQAFLKENNYLDFDDLLIKCVEVLESSSLILDKWRFRYHYIHVDEFQDTNNQQYQLVKLLAFEQNLFVVGDPDQNIYSWRGSKIDYILDFEKDFVGAITIKLEYNYRSKSHILNVANELISNNTQRIEKDLIATIDSDDKVIHYTADNALEEAGYVVGKINELIVDVEGVNYDDFAILYRSNYISRVFEQALTKARIDYRIIGGTRFFERKEIKDVIAYLRVMANKDSLSLNRIINLPKRKMGAKAIEKVTLYSESHHLLPYDALLYHLDDIKLSASQKSAMLELIGVIEEGKTLESIQERIELVISRFDLLEDYLYGSMEHQVRAENIQELINYAKASTEDMDEFLNTIALINNEDELDSPKVSLMTMHGAKGLEYKYVFCVHLNNGVFPSMKTLEGGAFEEERRLAYVAFTRAKEQLYILSHRYSQFEYIQHEESMFVSEVDSDRFEYEGFKPKRKKKTPIKKVTLDTSKWEQEASGFEKGSIVLHQSYGQGVIISISDNMASIAFKNGYGVKNINLNFVEKIK